MQVSKLVILFFSEKTPAMLIGVFYFGLTTEGTGVVRLFICLLGTHFLYLINSSVSSVMMETSTLIIHNVKKHLVPICIKKCDF